MLVGTDIARRFSIVLLGTTEVLHGARNQNTRENHLVLLTISHADIGYQTWTALVRG